MAEARTAIMKTLKLEGKWSNHPHDPGGKTFAGITEARYPGLPERLRAMPWEQAVEEIVAIYTRDYWDPLRLSEVNSQKVAEEMFDTQVNGGGPVLMAQRLCRALGRVEVSRDNAMGPVTLRALNYLIDQPGGEVRVLKILNSLQCERFVDLTEKDDLPPKPGDDPTHYRSFFKGWVDNRVQLMPSE